MAINAAPATEDVGNIVLMEHVNVTVPDQTIATWFYIVGLGFTRDPYLMVGPDNMWVNVGAQQFHLPTRGTQVVRGHVGLIVNDLEALKKRLKSIEEPLAGTKFAWSVEDGHVAVTCPWGNRYRCHAPSPELGDLAIGIPYLEFPVPTGTAAGIARFYDQVMHTNATLQEEKSGAVAVVQVGASQVIHFRETTDPIEEYDGHHIAVYVADFMGPYNYLAERGLIMEEIRNHQYRFKQIVDPDSGQPLFELEHEVRGLLHPMYARQMVNRNPAQSLRAYARGRDAF